MAAGRPAAVVWVDESCASEPAPIFHRGEERAFWLLGLDVMRPATGKVHRACAIRSLSGGVPPGLLMRDQQGNAVVVMLTGADGQPMRYEVQWAARAVRAVGGLELRDGLPFVRVRQLELAD